MSIEVYPISSDESVPDLVPNNHDPREEPKEKDTPHIVKVESISKEEFDKMDPQGPRADTAKPPASEVHVKILDAPTSPPSRREEEMDTQDDTTTGPSMAENPPREPNVEVKVYQQRTDSEEESPVKRKQARSEAWDKRKAQAQRKRLILKIKQNEVGPATLEVCRMSPTPMETPTHLFPSCAPPKEGPPYKY